jgi:hypothetical protein
MKVMKQSGKLKRQPGDFPQREKSPYSSARSPLRGTIPARLRMASSPVDPTDPEKNGLEALRQYKKHDGPSGISYNGFLSEEGEHG